MHPVELIEGNLGKQVVLGVEIEASEHPAPDPAVVVVVTGALELLD